MGLLRKEFECIQELPVEGLDLMAEDSTSDPTNFQFLKLLQVHSCQQDFLLGFLFKVEKARTFMLKILKATKEVLESLRRGSTNVIRRVTKGSYL